MIGGQLTIPIAAHWDGRKKMWTLRRVSRQHPEVKMKAYVAREIRIIEGPYGELRADELLTDLHNIIREDVLPLFARWLS